MDSVVHAVDVSLLDESNLVGEDEVEEESQESPVPGDGDNSLSQQEASEQGYATHRE